MKLLNLKRGNETAEHIALKSDLVRFLHHWGYGAVLGEHLNCDIAAVHPTGGTILALEIERSDRNAPENAVRNFAQGCSNLLIVCPNLQILGAVARKLSHRLSPELWPHTALATISALRLTQPIHFPNDEARKSKTERPL